jgi:hypothetical protein
MVHAGIFVFTVSRNRCFAWFFSRNSRIHILIQKIFYASTCFMKTV